MDKKMPLSGGPRDVIPMGDEGFTELHGFPIHQLGYGIVENISWRNKQGGESFAALF